MKLSVDKKRKKLVPCACKVDHFAVNGNSCWFAYYDYLEYAKYQKLGKPYKHCEECSWHKWR